MGALLRRSTAGAVEPRRGLETVSVGVRPSKRVRLSEARPSRRPSALRSNRPVRSPAVLSRRLSTVRFESVRSILVGVRSESGLRTERLSVLDLVVVSFRRSKRLRSDSVHVVLESNRPLPPSNRPRVVRTVVRL
jgi:hypothetical protein